MNSTQITITKIPKMVWISIAIIYLVLMIGLALFHGWKTFSSIPFGDTWNGYIEFLYLSSQGEAWRWWAQHNEHRILLSRIFYWMDAELFGGLGISLILINYLLLFVTAFFYCHVTSLLNKNNESNYKFLIFLLIISLCFSWIQNENIIWAFQSHFFMAQLFPLIAFYFTGRAIQPGINRFNFFISCFFGVLSAGTLANGVLALPLMTFYALLAKQELKKIFVYLFLSILVNLIYFYDYYSPANHGSFIASLKTDPVGILNYTLMYLGSPFFHLTGGYLNIEYSRYIALAAGSFFSLVSILLFVSKVAKNETKNINFFLLIFIIYVGGTAIGTAGGRLLFGLDQALSSRYTTPAIFGWLALLCLISPWLTSLRSSFRYSNSIVFSIILLLLLIYQLAALKIPRVNSYDRYISGLALSLGVKDSAQIEKIYPSSEFALQMTEKMKLSNTYFPNYEPFKGMAFGVGRDLHVPNDLPNCSGYLDEVYGLKPENMWVSVRGWQFNPERSKKPLFLYFLNGNHKIIGYALQGDIRPDVASANGKSYLSSGFRGYIQIQPLDSSILIVPNTLSCVTVDRITLGKIR
jgi:hypothetical protein